MELEKKSATAEQYCRKAMGVQIAEIESGKLSELLGKMPAIARGLLWFSVRKYSFREETLRLRAERKLWYVDVQKWIRNEWFEGSTKRMDTLHHAAQFIPVFKASSIHRIRIRRTV